MMGIALNLVIRDRSLFARIMSGPMVPKAKAMGMFAVATEGVATLAPWFIDPGAWDMGGGERVHAGAGPETKGGPEAA